MNRHCRLISFFGILTCCLISLAFPITAHALEMTDELPQASEPPSQEQFSLDEEDEGSFGNPSADKGSHDASLEDETVDPGSPSFEVSNDTEQPETADEAADGQTGDDEAENTPDEPDDPTSALHETVVVTISPSEHRSMVVDITGGSQSNGASARLYSSNSSAAQRFRIEPIEDSEYSYIFNVNSNKALDVKGGNATAGTEVQQYTWNQTDAQRWIVTAGKDGTHALFSALKTVDGGMLVLGFNESSGSLELHEYSEGSDLWILSETRTLEDGVYVFASGVGNEKVIDIKGCSMASSANAQIYASNGTNAQRFSVAYDEATGYYTIASVASGMALDVVGASKNNGANVQQYRPNGSAAQQWSIEPEDDGYVIVSRASGLVLDVRGGSCANGANVQQYRRNGSAAQHWLPVQTSAVADGCYIIPLFAAAGLGLDVQGGKTDAGTNIQLYRLNGTNAQSFEIVEYRSGLYTIRNLDSGLYLGLEGGLQTLGTNVELEAGLPLTDSKLWIIKPGAKGSSLISASGLALDVTGGALKSGTNVQGYESNGTASQLFVFKSIAAEGPGITDVYAMVSNKGGTASSEVISSRVDGTTYLFLPSCTDVTNVSLGYLAIKEGEFAEIALSEDGGYDVQEQLGSTDLTGGYETDELGGYLVWIRPVGSTSPNVVRVMVSAHIRALFILSDDPENEGRYWVESSPTHDNKTTGSMLMVSDEGDVIYDGVLTQIKGRGNGSWRRDKRPYQIKLSKKASLLDGSGGNKLKTWVLLSNRTDGSLVRDYVAKKLALALGIEETPDCEFVDLYYDGEYRGTYQLSEKVQIGEGRVDIDDLEEENESLNGDTSGHPTAQDINEFGFTFQYVTDMVDPEDISGGYLLELDNAYYRDERSWFETSAGVFVIKSPEDASYGEAKYISEMMQRAIDEAQRDDGDISTFFDMESLVKVLFVNELSKNPDYLRWSSTYFYKDKGNESLIVTGPAWDFDLAFGIRVPTSGMDCMAPDGLVSEAYGLFSNNEQYRVLLNGLFESELLPAAIDMLDRDSNDPSSIYGASNKLAASWKMNYALWGNYLSITPIEFVSQEDAVEQLWNWTAARLNWMAAYLMGSESPVIELEGPRSGSYVLSGGMGTVLDIVGGSMLAMANAQTWSANGTEAQKFYLLRFGMTDTGEECYVIFNVKSGLVLDVGSKDNSVANNVCQNVFNANATQTWVFRKTSSDGAGRYQIVNLSNGMALTMASSGSGIGANVFLANLNGAKVQEWYLRAA